MRTSPVPEPTPEAIAAARLVEASLRDASEEILVGLDATGREVLRKLGTRDRVDLEASEVRRLRHTVITHNHPAPRGLSLSLSDGQLAAMAVAREVRVVAGRWTYMLRPPSSGWSLDWGRRVLAPAYEAERRQIIPTMLERVRAGELSREDAEAAIHHEVWVRVAERLGMRYGREEETER